MRWSRFGKLIAECVIVLIMAHASLSFAVLLSDALGLDNNLRTTELMSALNRWKGPSLEMTSVWGKFLTEKVKALIGLQIQFQHLSLPNIRFLRGDASFV
jgi:hypothetical protein